MTPLPRQHLRILSASTGIKFAVATFRLGFGLSYGLRPGEAFGQFPEPGTVRRDLGLGLRLADGLLRLVRQPHALQGHCTSFHRFLRQHFFLHGGCFDAAGLMLCALGAIARVESQQPLAPRPCATQCQMAANLEERRRSRLARGCELSDEQ